MERLTQLHNVNVKNEWTWVLGWLAASLCSLSLAKSYTLVFTQTLATADGLTVHLICAEMQRLRMFSFFVLQAAAELRWGMQWLWWTQIAHMQGVRCLYFLIELWFENFCMTEFFTICLEQPRQLFLLNKPCAYKRSLTCNPKMIWMEKKEKKNVGPCKDALIFSPSFSVIRFMILSTTLIKFGWGFGKVSK